MANSYNFSAQLLASVSFDNDVPSPNPSRKRGEENPAPRPVPVPVPLPVPVPGLGPFDAISAPSPARLPHAGGEGS